MQKDLFKKINEVMPKLSKGHKSIGKYIIEHYDKIGRASCRERV